LFASRETEGKTDDQWIKEFLQEVCNSNYDYTKKTSRAVYTWSLRGYRDLNEDFSCIILAKSQRSVDTTIVTDDSVMLGTSVSSPPPAETIVLLIMWSRHIVAVENRSGMTTGETWLRNFENIIQNAKVQLSIPVAPSLEPIPLRNTILSHLSSFDKIYKFRVRLKLPNPELNRWARHIYDEMIDQQLSEYLQEFVSPAGIRKDENSKAYSSAALAELGYKEGGVQIDGERDGSRMQLYEGRSAISGRVDQLRSFVRGLATNATGVHLPGSAPPLRWSGFSGQGPSLTSEAGHHPHQGLPNDEQATNPQP
jgi:hypothetical protein